VSRLQNTGQLSYVEEGGISFIHWRQADGQIQWQVIWGIENLREQEHTQALTNLQKVMVFPKQASILNVLLKQLEAESDVSIPRGHTAVRPAPLSGTFFCASVK
jgi:hypothetical protein